MTTIVANGSTLTVTMVSGETITSDSTVAAGGLLDGAGNVAGAFALINLGTISGDVSGEVLSINTGSLTNAGTVFANNGSLTIQSAVAITNLSGGTLTGGTWEALGTGTLAMVGGPVITDNATITLNGTASTFDTGGGQAIDNTLTTVGAAGVLNILGDRNFVTSDSLVVSGTVALGGVGTLTAAGSGLILNAGGRIIGSGTLDPGVSVTDSGTIEASGGTLAVPQATFVTGAGTLKADAGASLVLLATSSPYVQNIVNNGTVDAGSDGVSGVLDISGAYSGSGGFLIQGGQFGARTVLELPAALSANVTFDTNVGELLLDAAGTFNGVITGFSNSDTIVLGSVGGAQSATLSGNILSINGGSGVVQTLTIAAGSENYTNAVWHVTENVPNTQATLKVSGVTAAACYAAGTRIKTATGEVTVEHLAAGDVVHARFAGLTPVVWVGHRHVNCRRHPEPEKVWPVRVSAHAFGPRMPHRDLVLSPDHAVFVDDALIPIKHLINGKTITQEKIDTVTYYHVELGEHDVLLAEGLPAESYLENGDRGAFDNAGEVVSLHPQFGARRWEAFGCVPLVVTGAKLDAVIARLRARVPKTSRGDRKLSRVA